MKKIEALRIQLLKRLGLMGAVNDYVPLTSRRIGELLGVSQQTASRYILDLLKQGLILRQLRARTQMIMITPLGLERLKKEYADYRQLFKSVRIQRITGAVVSGLGEGKYYIGQAEYLRQFQDRLWFKPFEGTLNVKVLFTETHKLKLLATADGILINGFEDPATGRTFGSVKCFLASIRTIECAIVMPVRSHYSDVLEVIAPVHLRSALHVEDGDQVAIEIYL